VDPLFFISYVHDSGEDDSHVHRFYDDLNHDVLMFAGRRANESAGFCDVSFKLGERWSSGLVEALSTAQVFIPLLSPAYFKSDACGKEWTMFTERLAQSGAPYQSSLIPLLWIPMRVPSTAQNYQYKERAFGVAYEEVKLRRLLRERRHVDDYREFVQVLADRIVTLAGSVPVRHARHRPSFEQIVSAFHQDGSVAAPPQRQEPAGNGRAPDVARDRGVRPILNTNLYFPEEP
jgi:hypothetical protein